jgi:sigma-B regulation protein RsbU (phosphoserine phosphatase)
LALQEGDALVIVTDGIGDTENVEGQDYTLNRALVDLTEMANAPAPELTAGLLSRVLGFAGEAPQFDDITILAVRIKGLKDTTSSDG